MGSQLLIFVKETQYIFYYISFPLKRPITFQMHFEYLFLIEVVELCK